MRMDDPEINDCPIKINGYLERLKKSPEYQIYSTNGKNKTKDRELRKIHRDHARFTFSELIHDTSLENFINILEQGKMKPENDRTVKKLGTYRFTWWGMKTVKLT